MRILILDDHEAIQHFLKQKITEIVPNATTIHCSTVEHASQVISGFPKIDYAICDIEIKSGANLTIPELCFNKNIPYMIYSSHVNKVLVNELKELKVNCYVSKTSSIDFLTKGLEILFTKQNYYCPLVYSTINSKDGLKETEKLYLSKGQKSVLQVMAQGYNREDVAKKLKLKKSTINNHIARARTINDCENFEELIRRYKFWDMDS
ncbi:MAG: Response regulator receiver domain [Bacteroidota bacterium]|jgi:DNA-binding NarL/FixJ family response regulator